MVATTAPTRRSTGQLVLLVSAVVLIVTFFLPWVNAAQSSPSGLGLATTANALQSLGINDLGIGLLLYLVPVLALVALALAFVHNAAAGPTSAAAGLLA